VEITDESVQGWLDEIKESKKREKEFRKNGKIINEIYNGEKSDSVPFNILYSNTETLKPALYSQTPRPVVKRRFNQDESPLISAVEEAGTRILEYFLDTNIDGYESFDDSMSDAVLDGALPGRGITQIKFDSTMEGEDKLKWAFVCADSRKWNQVHFGFAKKWSGMPWIAFEEYLDEDEAEKLFEEEVVKEMQFSETDEDEGDDTDKQGNKSKRKTALIYQIWIKDDREVKWISPQYDGYLKEQDDPLEITGFFPIPKPLMFHLKSNNLIPTALYSLYENQAKELNRITNRLNRVIEAIKVRGIYDGALGDELDKIMDEDDNSLVPTDKGATMIEGGFDKAIWFMPIEKLVGVAQTLMAAREQVKSVIYEITGLSDVIRGQSKASETLGAQKIKESWGTMRLKNHQKRVQYYVRDSLRIMLDIATTKIPQRLWIKMTGLRYPTNDEKKKAQVQFDALKEQAMKQVQAQKQQAQMMAQQGQQPPPMKPPPPPPPQLVELLQKPTWEEILTVLKDDLTRSFKIDIETNSTLDIEATEDQAQVSEFMNAMAQFMNGTMPMVKEKVLPFDAAKSMFLEIARRFRFGSDVEEQLQKMVEPKGLNEEQLKKQADELKKKSADIQKQFEAKKQEIEAESKKIAETKQKVGQELDKQVIDLNTQKMEFEFEKKLFAKQMDFDKQMAEKEHEMELKEAKSEISELVEKSKRDTQSLLDRHCASVEKLMPEKVEPDEEKGVNITNVMPDGTKSITINRDDDGRISGAEIENVE